MVREQPRLRQVEHFLVNGRGHDAFNAGLFSFADGGMLNVQVVDGTPQQVAAELRRLAERGPRYWHVAAVDRGDASDAVIRDVLRRMSALRVTVVVERCPAPAAGDWNRRCGNWLVTRGGGRGRRSTYCSPACRIRVHREVEAKKEGRRKRP
jgi:hypothetical protein